MTNLYGDDDTICIVCKYNKCRCSLIKEISEEVLEAELVRRKIERKEAEDKNYKVKSEKVRECLVYLKSAITCKYSGCQGGDCLSCALQDSDYDFQVIR